MLSVVLGGHLEVAPPGGATSRSTRPGDLPDSVVPLGLERLPVHNGGSTSVVADGRVEIFGEPEVDNHPLTGTRRTGPKAADWAPVTPGRKDTNRVTNAITIDAVEAAGFSFAR